MRSFQHNLDGTIIISVDEKRYQETLENFRQDYSLNYQLPSGYVGRIYFEDRDHYIIKEAALHGWQPDNNVFQDPEWEEGSIIFDSFASIVEKQGLRIEAANQAQIQENILKEQLKTDRALKPTPLAKYHNIVRVLQEVGLLDKLLKSKNFSSLAKLGLNTALLYDDEHIKKSLVLVVAGIEPPLSEVDISLFDHLLEKSEFDFTLSQLLIERDLNGEPYTSATDSKV